MKISAGREGSHNQKTAICSTSIEKLQTCPNILYSAMWSLLQIFTITHIFLLFIGGSQRYSYAASTLKQEK